MVTNHRSSQGIQLDMTFNKINLINYNQQYCSNGVTNLIKSYILNQNMTLLVNVIISNVCVAVVKSSIHK